MDVAIVGAGIIGTSIAWRLAQAGARVTLLDAGKAGGEASWAGAGMLAPGGEFSERSPWTDFALESLRLYPGFVAELQEATGCSIDFARPGALETAADDDAWHDLYSRAGLQMQVGIRCELRPAEKTVFYPDDAAVDPRHVTGALLRAGAALGVRLVEGCRVLEVLPRGEGVELVTGQGTVGADYAVLAAGAWSGAIPVPGHTIPPSFPVRGHLVGYQLEPGSLGPMRRSGATYILQRASGFTIAGSSMEMAGFERTLDEGIIRDIRARATRLLPRLGGLEPAAAWLGFRPATADHRPVIVRLEGTTVWLAYGHFRNGILLAPATAQRVSREIISSSGTGST